MSSNTEWGSDLNGNSMPLDISSYTSSCYKFQKLLCIQKTTTKRQGEIFGSLESQLQAGFCW